MKKLKVPKRMFVFLVGILSIIGALFLWCPDPPTSSKLSIKLCDGDCKTDVGDDFLFSDIAFILASDSPVYTNDAPGGFVKFFKNKVDNSGFSDAFNDEERADLEKGHHASLDSQGCDYDPDELRDYFFESYFAFTDDIPSIYFVDESGVPDDTGSDTDLLIPDLVQGYHAFLEDQGCNANDPESVGCKDLYKKSLHFVETIMDDTGDKLGETSGTDIGTDKDAIKTFDGKTADDFSTEPVTSGNTDFENEQKPAIAKAGFGMPTAVGLVIFAFLLWGVRHQEIHPALVTSQAVSGVKGNGFSIPQSFMITCENDSEDTYEARREVRLQRRYRAYVEAFQEIGSDPAIREYLFTRLCEEIPRKKELIRKAFEHTAKAA